MNILDVVEVWSSSLRSWFESTEVVLTFDRTRDERLNPSCVLNVRRRKIEADLIVWESGEAELVFGTIGAVEQKHFDDIRQPQELAAVLSLILKVLQVV